MTEGSTRDILIYGGWDSPNYYVYRIPLAGTPWRVLMRDVGRYLRTAHQAKIGDWWRDGDPPKWETAARHLRLEWVPDGVRVAV